ncbi:MAG: tRNA (adenosine(37)-N6)-dimethylallyltransferase MiaA [Pseudonocardiaceae bacterium]
MEPQEGNIMDTVKLPIKLVVIIGTNASGKSSLAVDLAELFAGEVISADSRQIYRGLDIGAGKITPSEMRNIPHHLINVAELDSTFSLADYQRLAYATIDNICDRGLRPFLVGGTGLYVRSITQGYNLIDVPPDQALRDQLEQRSSHELWAQLESADPAAAGIIDPRNKRRLIRALELCGAGRKYSEQHASSPRYSALQLGLTWPPDTLRERIHTRLLRRIKEGMIEETENLLRSGVSRERLDSLGLEYRHLVRYIDGTYKTEKEFIEKLAVHIYRFSRKQIIWFRRDTDIKWLNPQGDYRAEAVELINDHLRS